MLSDSAHEEGERTAMDVDEVEQSPEAVPRNEKNGIGDRLNAFKSVTFSFSLIYISSPSPILVFINV